MPGGHPISSDGQRAGGGPVFVARRTVTGTAPARVPITHTFAALALYTGGTTTIEQDGRWTMERGDLMLVPAGQAHRFLETEQGEFWGLGFCVPCFASEDAGALLAPFERVREGASPVVHIAPERQPFLESLFRELAQAAAPDRRAEPIAVQRAFLTLILDEVMRSARWPESSASAAGVVTESLRFIERRCLGPLTVREVAEAVGRTASYVTTTLTRATGRSAVGWIVAGRMAEARRQLLHSDERIDVIAERVGYADPTHFIRMFRREHGATPAAWRTAQRARP